jgi:predicted nucleic acid-binding protein
VPLRAVFLDTGPLGLVTGRADHPDAEACRAWAYRLQGEGVSLIVPEVADYELRRELIRAGKAAGIGRLDLFEDGTIYLPITTGAMREAARLWARVRNAGLVTAPPLALDGDAILAGQVLDYCEAAGVSVRDIVVASVNVRHLDRFVPSALWSRIDASPLEGEEAREPPEAH